MTQDLAALVAALRTQRQIDMDGCEVAVSRQACDEAADTLEAQAAEIARLHQQWEDHDAAWSERVAALTATLAEANREAITKIAEATEARMKAQAALDARINAAKEEGRVMGLREAGEICNASYGDGLGHAHAAIVAKIKEADHD